MLAHAFTHWRMHSRVGACIHADIHSLAHGDRHDKMAVGASAHGDRQARDASVSGVACMEGITRMAGWCVVHVLKGLVSIRCMWG